MTTVAAPVRRLSLDEFRRLPEGPPYCEREPDGELSEVSSATSRHNMLMALLFAMLHAFARLQKLGGVYLNTDVYLPSGRVYIPDLCFVAKEQGDLVGEDGKVHGVPNLVVEIVSPGNPTRDRVTKFRAYHDEGVEWLWLIDSESLDVEEYQLLEGRYVSAARCARGQTFHPGVFPGCAIDLDALMSE